jgi:cytochrome c553
LKLLLLAVLLCPAIALADSPSGQQIALHGNDNGALPCAACHGLQGEGKPSIGAPRLAGLPAAEIEIHLKQFASGSGGDATMQNIAQALSPEETAAVADYFAGLKAP